MTNRRKRMMDFEYEMGFMVSLTVYFMLTVLALCFTGNFDVIRWIVLVYFIALLFKPFAMRRDIMFAWIKEHLGIKVMNMKLEVLAKHFNLKYIHVPEHYECEKEN